MTEHETGYLRGWGDAAERCAKVAEDRWRNEPDVRTQNGLAAGCLAARDAIRTMANIRALTREFELVRADEWRRHDALVNAVRDIVRVAESVNRKPHDFATVAKWARAVADALATAPACRWYGCRSPRP